MSEDKSKYELKSVASIIRNMRRALSADELAELLSISRITVLRRAKRGQIPSFRIGGLVRFDSAAISKWLLASGVKSMSKR
jgi:excisionase family DNA binding protein